MNPGRNDPCPCGSGKKYKLCCLNAANSTADSPEMLTWRRIRRALDGLPNTMLRFTVETFGPTALEEAWEEFVLDTDLEYSEFDPKTDRKSVV